MSKSKTIKKNGLLLTNNSHFVSVAHESGEFRVCFAPEDDDRVYMAMTIPFFRVIASLVRYAVNYLEPEFSPCCFLAGCPLR